MHCLTMPIFESENLSKYFDCVLAALEIISDGTEEETFDLKAGVFFSVSRRLLLKRSVSKNFTSPHLYTSRLTLHAF